MADFVELDMGPRRYKCSLCGQWKKGHKCTGPKLGDDNDDQKRRKAAATAFSSSNLHAEIFGEDSDNDQTSNTAALSSTNYPHVKKARKSSDTALHSPANKPEITKPIDFKLVKWMFEDGHTYDLNGHVYFETNNWKAIDNRYCKELTDAYGTFIQTGKGDKITIDFIVNGLNCTYNVDFHAMTQTKVNNGFVRRIRPGSDGTEIPYKNRSAKASVPEATTVATFSSITNSRATYQMPTFRKLDKFDEQVNMSLPPYWPNSLGITRLKENDSLFQEVASMFTHSFNSQAPFNLECIELVHNPARYISYQAKKQEIIQDGVHPNEQWGWHGTYGTTAESIIQNGMVKEMNQTSAYGRGTYFAKNAHYSFPTYCKGYSTTTPNRPDGKHEKTLLLSRVLVGDTCIGNQTMLLPPSKPNGLFYNSMSNSDKSIFVLSARSDAQAYVEFVLRFVQV